MQIRDVVAAKAVQDVVTIGPDASVRDLLTLLTEHNVGASIVSADGTGVDGIVSERDVVRRLHTDESLLDATVASIMTADVYTCESTEEVTTVMRVMTDRRIRHVPVFTEGALSGVVSVGDIVKRRLDQLEFEHDQLNSYISASQS